MKELQDIVKAYQKATAAGMQAALATVVHVEGSSYRRPGARMLVTEDGKLTGAISGGCLEGDALRKALLVMARKQPMVVTYDTMEDDDTKLGVGLGCNGIVHILIEPVDAGSKVNAIDLFKAVIDRRRAAILVTLFSLFNKKALKQGTCLLMTGEEKMVTTPFEDSICGQVLADADEALQKRSSAIESYGGEEHLYGLADMIEPVISLVIAGAGNDAIPLVKMAAVLGWQTTIADGRPNYATAERFPLADKVIVSPLNKALSEIAFDERTAVILMTHNYNYDIAVLKQSLVNKAAYIGALGPKRKMERMLHELQEEGAEPNSEQVQTLYGPVGLDIGAETAEEIALSIVAEIKAAFAKRPGTSLRDKRKPIHANQLLSNLHLIV